MISITAPIPDVIFPIVVTTPPINNRTGPIAAIISPALTIVFFTSGDSPSHHSFNDWTFSLTSSNTGVSISPRVSPTSAPISLRVFITIVSLSAGSCMPSKVSLTLPAFSSRDWPKLSRLIEPFRRASAMAGPALVPNNSIAICMASSSDVAISIWLCMLARASFIGFPSFVAFCSAFFNPAIAVLESIPDVSSCPRNDAESAALNPISLRTRPFETMLCARLSTLIPVFCPVLFSVSRRIPASSAFSP